MNGWSAARVNADLQLRAGQTLWAERLQGREVAGFARPRTVSLCRDQGYLGHSRRKRLPETTAQQNYESNPPVLRGQHRLKSSICVTSD